MPDHSGTGKGKKMNNIFLNSTPNTNFMQGGNMKMTIKQLKPAASEENKPRIEVIAVGKITRLGKEITTNQGTFRYVWM